MANVTGEGKNGSGTAKRDAQRMPRRMNPQAT